VGLARVSSGWGPEMPSHTPDLVRLIRTFLQEGGKMMARTKGKGVGKVAKVLK